MRITRRAGLKGLTVGAAAVALPGIARSEEPEIVIGAPNSLTGGIGEGGQRTVWALQIAIDQINREGGIKSLGGAKLRLVVADTTSENPTQAASVARRMIDQDNATLLVGATASAMTLALQVETEKSGIPPITNSYADGIVTRGYKNTFKITPQGGGIWNWSMTSAYDLWKASKGSLPKSALIFMSNDAVGLVVQKQLPEHAKTLNLDVPFSQSFQMGLSDPSVSVAPVLRYKTDLIFLGGFTNDIILIIKALRGVGVTAPIFGAGPAGYDFVGEGSRGCVRPVLCADDLELGYRRSRKQGIRCSLQDGATQCALSARQRDARRRLGDGADIGQTLEKAGSRDPAKLRDVLATTEFTNLPLPATKIKFGSDGLNEYGTGVLAEWIKGEIRTVWPKYNQAAQPLF